MKLHFRKKLNSESCKFGDDKFENSSNLCRAESNLIVGFKEVALYGQVVSEPRSLVRLNIRSTTLKKKKKGCFLVLGCTEAN